MKTVDAVRMVCNYNNIDYELFEDKISLTTAASGVAAYNITLFEAAPTLIVKANRDMIAAIIRGDTKISFKKLKNLLKVKNIRLAKPEEVYNLTGTKIGDVSLINYGIKTLIDNKILANQHVYGGCGLPNHTLKIKVVDLIKITNATVIDFTHLKTDLDESRIRHSLRTQNNL
jgi:prolyl-tRNA editing enzyme YbaK/EbsC (Cys-tRNA(Pro) deacylase)